MLKKRYQGMAKLVHPDHNPGVEEANLVLAALNILHEDAERKIADGTFGKSLATVTFKDRKTNRTIEELEPLTRGDIADLYTGRLDGKKVVLKIASDAGDSDLIKNEATVLRKLAEAPDADHFMKYLPKLIAGGDTTWDQGLCTRSTNETCSGLTAEGQRHRLALWLDAYPTRHGRGPFPTFSGGRTAAFPDKYNPTNRWQGALRTGFFDMSLCRYALDACSEDLPIDGLAITHLDQIDRGGVWTYSDEYQAGNYSKDLQMLSRQLRLVDTSMRAKVLERYTPHYKDIDNASIYNVLGTIEHLVIGPRVWIKSFGPTARDKEFTSLLPLPTT
jgi:hypothetical protein